MQYKYLSHPLTNSVPVYGNRSASLCLTPVKSISKGDSANVFQFTMENHWGTHVDAPAHFFDKGDPVTAYLPNFWVFDRPRVVEVEIPENTLIGIERLEEKLTQTADLILIKTGFQKWRGEEKYSFYNPGIKPEVGFWLRRHFPSVRAVGFDFISLSAYQQRQTGREAHRAFLDPDGDHHPILVVEDMNLSDDISGIIKLWIAPLQIAGADSAPCTVIGGFS